MTRRFLTPAKVGQLILIEIYTEAVVPHSSRIPIISFLLTNLLPSASNSDHNESLSQQPDEANTDLKSFESLLTAHASVSNFREKTLWDYFLKKLWDIDSSDSLHAFFMKLSNLLVKSHDDLKNDSSMGIPPPSEDMILLSRTSPLGSFIRRSQLEYEGMKFSDSLKLWKSLLRWRSESRNTWSKLSGNIGKWAGDRVLDENDKKFGRDSTRKLELIIYGSFEEEDSPGEFVSTDDVEKLLEFQVDKMQHYGSRMSRELKEKFRSFLDQSILVPSLSHYLIFLDSWRAGDYTTSFDSLHRYFDYTMQNRDRLFYQYALMNLAILQADFSCFNEAVASMLETVSTARENRDIVCLNFALNWIYHFGKTHPTVLADLDSTNMLGTEREGLSFLQIKAKETGMWNLWCSSLLSDAKLGMINGESVGTAFENITKSSHIAVEKNLKCMTGPLMAMRSSLWERLGVAHLSRQYCEAFMQCHMLTDSSFDDTLRCTGRIAHFLVNQGQYKLALEMLDQFEFKTDLSWKSNQYWLKCQGIFQLKRYLAQNKLDNAFILLSQLLQNNGEDADAELSFEITALHIDYLMRRTDYSRALMVIEESSKLMWEHGYDVNLRVQLLLLKASIYDKAGRPQKGFSIAIRAANIAWRSLLLPALWAAMGAIANILTSLHEFQASTQILKSIFPRVLECDNSELSAQLYSFLADAYLGLAGQTKPLERRQNLLNGLKFIKRAGNEYSNLEDIKKQSEMSIKAATILRLLGETTLAREYTEKCMKLKQLNLAIDGSPKMIFS